MTRRALAIACGLLALASCARAQCPAPADDEAHPGARIQSDTPLFILPYEESRIYRGGFDGRPWRVFAGEKFERSAATVSPDHRWLIWTGERKERETDEIWLFDLRLDTSRRLIERPKTTPVAFSPDGKRGAFFSEYRRGDPTTTGVGLYVIDTEAGRVRFSGYPPRASVSRLVAYGWLAWSVEGDLLVQLIHNPRPRDNFAYSPEDESWERIDGTPTSPTATFSRSGRVLTLWEHPAGIGQMFDDLASKDGRSTAKINRRAELWVSHRGAKPRLVRRHLDCEDAIFGVLGWVDGDALLVFRTTERHFVLDTKTWRTAPLFLGHYPEAFSAFWYDDAPKLGRKK